MNLTFRRSAVLVSSLALVVACGTSSSGGSGNTTPVDSGIVTNTGSTCSSASQCYPGFDGGVGEAGTIAGTVVCLTQLQDGYCSHTCNSDSDCCSVPGECTPGVKEICAPLESTAQTYCFLSCETADIPADGGTDDAGVIDANLYCARFANPTFTCRSTGGGANNKKFCGP